MSDAIDPKVVEAAYERLTEKLYKWLFAQPEWVLCLAAPRNIRKGYARGIADHVTRIPTFTTNPVVDPLKPLEVKRLEGHDDALD